MEPHNPACITFAATRALPDAAGADGQVPPAATAVDDPIDLPPDLPAADPEPPGVDGAPTPHDTIARAALHDDRLWQLARRGQGTVLCLEFELHTRLARQAFRRDFAYVSRQLLGLETSRRVQRLDRAELDDALRSVRRRGDELQARLACLAAELDALSSQAPAAVFEPAAPARLRATVLSPSARRFVELLQAVDQVVCRVERAWLLGALTPARRTAIIGECRRALGGFKELVRERRHAIGSRVREVNAWPHGAAPGPTKAPPAQPA